jgi:DNA-binding NarL/FixJ family response regulator
MKIKIIIVDDHPLILKGFQNTLSGLPDIELIGVCPNGTELLHMLQSRQPDVLLMDIQIPDIPGDKLAPMVLRLYPDMPILNLTNIDSAIYASNMLRLGVKGYLLKTASEKRLLEAIKTVFSGSIFIDPDMQNKMAQLDQVIKKALSTKPTLTPREKELLQLIVEGYNGPEIASKMFLSVNTVEKYRENLIFKLDVRNTASLVAKALKIGLAY